MAAEEIAVASAWLVAVTVTVCGTAIVAGAVYKPEEVNDPAPAGLSDQVTAWFGVFVTDAASCSI
jgi:hypothetical protein